MIYYDKYFKDVEDMRGFVLECENKYISQVKDIAKSIAKADGIKFILLSGPSCSGKTTSAKILFNELALYGREAAVVSIDDFYRDRGDISDDEKPDFESASALDLEYFSVCISEILSGREALLPKYDFITGKRNEYVRHMPKDNEIIVFEGIQALYPEISDNIPKDKRKSIYISVADDVCAYGYVFMRRDIRFMRRLVRDYQFRAAHPERTLELWKGVIENEDKNIIPNSANADYTINSLLLYEINVMEPYILNLVTYDFNNSDERRMYDEYSEKFSNIPDLPSSLVPDDSVFREFIGPRK